MTGVEQPGSGPNAGEPSERLFFALWPEDALRVELQQAARAAARRSVGRAVRAENLHVTLAFLGAVEKEARACAEQVAAALRFPAFTLVLDRVGYWPRPRILWIGAALTPPPLLALAGDLNRELAACGFTPERRPFQVHITVLRNAQRGPREAEMPALAWPVRDFALVRSHLDPAGARYEVLRQWPCEG